MPIRFQINDSNPRLQQKTKLKQFLLERFHEYLELKEVDVSYIFCTDESLLKINIDFLDHNTYTDIITFDLSETSDRLVSEIYISVDRVKENADKYEVSYEKELHRVIFHGILHLIGFEDKTDEQQQEMRNMENQFLKQYFS